MVVVGGGGRASLSSLSKATNEVSTLKQVKGGCSLSLMLLHICRNCESALINC